MKRIFCKLCKCITDHLDMGYLGSAKIKWKCSECGEYHE